MRNLAFTLSLALCALSASSAQAKLKVVSSLPDLAAIAAEVGGEYVEVSALAGPTIDPHYVDPRPSLILVLSRADLLLVNGLQLESAWLTPLSNNARNSAILPGAPGYFDASTVVQRLAVPNQRIDRAMGDIHPGGNPHFTFDPRRAAPIASAIAVRLAQLDPEHAAAFAANEARLHESLDRFAVQQAARFAKLEAARRKVVAYHMSLIYLWDWLGLEQVATLEPKPGIAPTPSHVAQVLKQMRSTQTRVIVQEGFYPTGPSQTLSTLAKAKLVVVPGATDFGSGQSYLTHLQEVTDAIFAGLSL